MPLPVIPDVWRVTVNYTPYKGVAPVNVIHIRATTGDALDVGAAVNEAADGLELATGTVGDMHPTSMDIIALDGVGATATVPMDTGAWTTASAATGEIIPEGCAVVSLRSVVRGPKARGRVYIGPLSEASVDAGVVSAGTTGPLEGSWNSFRTALIGLGDGTELVIASYTHAEAFAVTSLHVSGEMGFQKRRLLQTRT